MSIKDFLIQLSAVAALAAVLIFLPGQVLTGWNTHRDFGWAMLLLFALLSAFLFFMGSITARSTNKSLFHGVVMGSVLVKLVLGLAALFIYSRKYFPINNLYIWIFLIVYIVFTVWEVKYMTRLAKLK